jgi:hypothetical protein
VKLKLGNNKLDSSGLEYLSNMKLEKLENLNIKEVKIISKTINEMFPKFLFPKLKNIEN